VPLSLSTMEFAIRAVETLKSFRVSATAYHNAFC
jgi:hypothetical protein